LNTPNITEGLKLLFKENILHEIFPKFPFLSPSEEPNIPDRVLEKFSKIKVGNTLTRLFGILLILSDKNKLSVSDFEYISDDLGLVNRQRSHFERLFHSWKSFPKNCEENTIRRWVRATGINSSKVLVHILFLIYELELPDSKRILKKTYLDAVQNAVNRLKSGDQS
jgi:hypothetical protein